MDILQAIHERRTVRTFSPKPLEDGIIRSLLEAGTWAPSHGNSQPWEFIIIGTETRKKLAEAYSSMMEAGPLKNPAMPEERKEIIRKFAQDFGGAPLLFAVACPPAATDLEKYDNPLTIGALIQNILLAAWEKNIAGVWLSLGYNPQAQAILDIQNGGSIGGILAMGYTENVPPAPGRISVSDKTRSLP